MFREYDDYIDDDQDLIHGTHLDNLRELLMHLAMHANTEPAKIDMSEVDACLVEMASILGVRIEERVN